MDQLSIKQAAVELGISERTVLDRIKAGRIQAEQVNGWLWLIDRAEVERWRGTGKMRPGRKRKNQS